jgi:hypothetical protein
MSLRPWHVVAGWGVGNLVLVAVLFGFHESLWGELLYLASGFPLAVFAAAIWYSDHISHSGVRTLGGSAIAAVPFGLGSALLGVGLIFATWLAIVGGVLVVLSGAELLRSRPQRLHASVAELARLPVRTLASPPTFSTAAMEEESSESEPESSVQSAGVGRAKRRGTPMTTSLALGAAAAAWLREVVRARQRRTDD